MLLCPVDQLSRAIVGINTFLMTGKDTGCREVKSRGSRSQDPDTRARPHDLITALLSSGHFSNPLKNKVPMLYPMPSDSHPQGRREPGLYMKTEPQARK